jgi:hypothetical protein
VTEIAQAHPLQWPAGWKRTSSRKAAAFKVGGSQGRRLELGDGINRVYRELHAMGIPEHHIVISSDLRTRLDGKPYAGQAFGKLDPSVAVYWLDRGKTRCMAIDRYDRLADNLGAIAATIEAMRAIERHGGAEILDRAFSGFLALPAPEQAWQVLGLPNSHPTQEEVDAAHRRIAMANHPDRDAAGDGDLMARANVARDDLYAQRGWK